jgi:hypothetical protein
MNEVIQKLSFETILNDNTYLSVNYLQLPWTRLWLIRGPYQGDQGRAEEHFDDSTSAVICGE